MPGERPKIPEQPAFPARRERRRTPALGELIDIPAGYGVKVSAGSKLKDAAKGK